MVAIVSGNTLGVSLTSLATLGNQGTIGKAAHGNTGEQVYVNVSSGNLVVQDRDDQLLGRGLDAFALRTYNSRGAFDDDNGDNWSSGFYTRNLVVAGTPNAAGSTVTRIAQDGASASYAWDAASQSYRTTAGAGAYDTITFAAGVFTWTDGDTGMQESYRQSDGKLTATSDGKGNQVAFDYNAAGRIAKVTTATGDFLTYEYVSGTNDVKSITATAADGTTTRRASYAYKDGQLNSITVDLSPADLSTTDNNKYTTTYVHNKDTRRLESITQADGTRLSFEYDTSGRVAKVTDALNQVTTFSYLTGRTKVTDALSKVTYYDYDAAGQLKSITAPPVAGISQVTSFTYNASGDLVKVTHPGGRFVEMGYDANGNRTLEIDKAGNTVERKFDSGNRLVAEAKYLVRDPDGLAGSLKPSAPVVNRYVYDTAGKNLLRFEVRPEGRVTEHRYDAFGQRTLTFTYLGDRFDTSGLLADQAPTLAAMETFASSAMPGGASRTEYGYDYDFTSALLGKGVLKSETTWSLVGPDGTPAAAAVKTITEYVHDYFGTLLHKIVNRGTSAEQKTSYLHDGLGRVKSTTNALGQVTMHDYDAALNTVRTTAANNLVTTDTFDKAGRLTSSAQAEGLGAALGTTKYAYDSLDRLVQTQDATGVRSWILYDDAGRKVADVDGDGTLTEYIYNLDNLLTRSITYANNALPSSFVDGTGNPSKPQLETVRPAANAAADRSTWYIHDDAGRLVKTIDADGAVTQNSYDGASRIVKVTRFAKPVATSTLGNAPADFVAPPDADHDRVVRYFHDGDGLLVATLDGEGYLTEFAYDATGRLQKKVQYAGQTGQANWAAGTIAQLLESMVAATHDKDRTSWQVHNAKGQLVGEVDAEGYFTERVYDEAGNLAKSIRYAEGLTAEQLGQPGETTDLALSVLPALVPTSRTTCTTS